MTTAARPVASPAQLLAADEHAGVGVWRREASRRVFALTNEIRSSRGRTPLRRDSTLSHLACRHNQDMLVHGYVGHEEADGQLPSDRAAREHRRLIGSVGENVYKLRREPTQSDRSAAQSAIKGWMESPGHRANILRPAFTHLGTCVTQAGTRLVATQMFAALWAYLDRPLPWSASSGDTLSVSITPVKAPVPPAEYAFVPVGEPLSQAFSSAERGRSFGGTILAPTTPGRYGTRFLFPTGDQGRYTVLSGPRVSVK